MSKPLFSIIVPVYNVEKYIHQCVDSVLGQTFVDFELILVNDGSPYNCPQICDEYAAKDERVYVIHKENGGVTSARKAGLNIAKGDYVIYVDSDDWLSGNYLNIANEILNKHNPDIICFGHYSGTNMEYIENKMPYRTGMYFKDDIEREIFPILLENEYALGFSPALWAKIFRRDLIENPLNALDNSIRIGEDGAIVKPVIYLANSIYIDNHSVYYYRLNPNSATQIKKARNWDDIKLRAKFISKYINMNEGDFQKQLYRSIVHALFNVVVSQFNRREKYSVIVKDIKEKLNEDIYAEAVKNAKFKNLKGKMSVWALKYRWMLFLKIYNRIK